MVVRRAQIEQIEEEIARLERQYPTLADTIAKHNGSIFKAIEEEIRELESSD